MLAEMPAQMRDLNSGERLLVWSFRRWVGGTRNWSMVWREFLSRFRAEPARTTLAAFVRVVDVIRINARRTVHYHQPCCPCLSEDEVLLTSMIGAAQCGRCDLVRSYALELVRDQAADDLVFRVLELSEALTDREVSIPHRHHWDGPIGSGTRAAEGSATLH